MIELNGKFGYIDHQGKLVIEARFDDANDFDSHNNLARVTIGDQFGYIDRSGKLVTVTSYTGAGDFGIDGQRAPVKLDGKLGFIDRSGKLAIPAQFTWTDGFNSKTGYALVETKDEKYGFIDRSGKFVFPLALAAEPFDDASGLAPAYLPDRGLCFLHSDGTITEMVDGKSIGNIRWNRY